MHRNLWIKLAKIWGQVGGGQLAVGGRDPPHGRFGGGDCGGLQYIKAIRLLGDKWLIHKNNEVQKIPQ
jgi:hypothetical protein